MLPGAARKVSVLIDWMLDLVFRRDIARISVDRDSHVHMAHYEPGEVIIAKNEIGRELFAVRDGEVEVFQPATDSTPEKRVTVLRPGEVFGEKALIANRHRSASVRALTPVDVLVVPREDFAALVGQLAVLRGYFDGLMNERYGLQAEAASPRHHRDRLIRPEAA
jgi:CRP-like cAMP-binding protein